LLDFRAEYEETSTTALSANPAVAVPLLTISGWIVMQRKVTGGSVSFNKNWAAYRDGFGSATVNDNYWLGLDKVYRLMQLGNAKLRIEAKLQLLFRPTGHFTTGWAKKRDSEPGPILSVFPALIVHSELKVCTPDFQWHLFFKHKLINK